MTDASPDPDDIFTQLATTASGAGAAAMFDTLAASLKARGRWHALFDLRLLEARIALGLPATGELVGRGEQGDVSPADRDQLDDRSLAACREVGWPLLDEGQVAAAWMYLRAAAAPAEVAAKLAALAAGITATGLDPDDEDATARLQEIVHVALWEGVDPALGIDLVIRMQGTCNAITAYEQAVSRLPARRQEPAAGVLVHHLHGEVVGSLAADLAQRGAAVTAADASVASMIPLLARLREVGGADDPSIHVDVSHLQSVLRIARICADSEVVRKAWELACYACRLPSDVVYPGEPPFENVGESSRLFFGAQLGHEVDRAISVFRRAAARARLEESGRTARGLPGAGRRNHVCGGPGSPPAYSPEPIDGRTAFQAGTAAAIPRVANLCRRLETAAGGQLPRGQHVWSFVRAVAAPPPVARIARIGATGLIVLGTAIPPAAAGIAIRRGHAAGPAARATGAARPTALLELGSRGRRDRYGDSAAQHQQHDAETECALHVGCFGPRVAAASAGAGPGGSVARSLPGLPGPAGPLIPLETWALPGA